jgi:hypothetical protein
MNATKLCVKLAKIDNTVAVLENSKPSTDDFRRFYNLSDDVQFALLFEQYDVAYAYFYDVVKSEIDLLKVLRADINRQLQLLLAEEILNSY